MSKAQLEFIPLPIAVMTVSDKRTLADDTTGDYLAQAAQAAGHQVVARNISKDNRYQIRAKVSQWIADETIAVILINGGTGFSENNCTPESIIPLFDRDIEGFGEAFRQLSFADIGTSAMQSRALGGIANRTLIFAMPGSGNASKLAWEKLICEQLDARHRPCNFYPHIRRLDV